MKKMFALMLAAIMMLAGAGSYCGAAAETEVSVWFEGERIIFPDAQPVHTGTRVLIPVRGFFEKIDVTVDWNSVSRTVIIKDDSREIMMEADNRAVLNNGVVEYLDCSVIIRSNRAFVPIRYISESFGYDVKWDGKTKSVHVSRPPGGTLAIQEDTSTLPTIGDLESFYNLLKYNDNMAYYLRYYGPEIQIAPGVWNEPEMSDDAPSDQAAQSKGSQAPGAADDYSGTNVQVEGVDEGDLVKTDGKYIYIAGYNELKIINADPEDLRIVSRIPCSGRVSEIYIQEDKLVLINGNSSFEYPVRNSIEENLLGILGWRRTIASTNVKVYDVSDRTKPVLINDKDYEGRYLSSGLIDDDLYIVTNSSVRFFSYELYDEAAEMLATNDKNRFIEELEKELEYDSSVLEITGARDSGELFDSLRSLVESYVIPRYVDNRTGEIRGTGLKDIYYFKDMVRPNYMITVGLDLGSGREDIKTYLGSSGSMYASGEHMYTAVSAYEYNVLRSRLERIPYYDYLTTVHRFGLEDGRITYEARGRVPGQILNQFSMDEYKGVFRIATTTQGFGGSTGNNIYMLDEDLKIKGRLEGIAEGERIYSTRFAGERIYMVTFRQTDPFFVIDAADPAKPKVLGYLKIPGYSTYMHILDKDHVLGFGYETDDINGWAFSTTGFKISLFDVTDVSNPVEAKKEVIGQKAESLLADDHKALMISLEKGIMGFPVNYMDSDSGYFAGYYLYNISTNDFSYRGRVTHIPEGTLMYDIDAADFICRGLYIGNNLYTVSDSQLQVHDLGTFAGKGRLSLR